MAFLAVNQLHDIAGGLNIEGGFPSIALNQTCQHSDAKLWANLILVLDRPLVDHVIFDEIVRIKTDNQYPLLENAIEEINECHFMTAYYMIIAYYYNEGRQILNLNNNQSLGITIHVHQDRNCQPLLDLIQSMVNDVICESKDKNVNVSIRSDDPSYASNLTNKDYQNTHILISLSQCAGLDPKYATGSLLMSSTFVPYDIENREIRTHSEYQEKNDLIQRLNVILSSHYNQFAVNYIRQNYQSANCVKLARDCSQLMQITDFPETKILQVDQLWNPISPDELVLVDIKPNSSIQMS